MTQEKQTSLPLDLTLDSKYSLPTAKVKKSDKTGVHSWVNFYASYSESFVNSAINSLNIKEDSLILDPFVGSGTTLVSAFKNNIDAIGVDLDPFSCLLSKSKVATNVDYEKVEKLLINNSQTKDTYHFNKTAEKIFSKDSLLYASSLFRRIYKETNTNRNSILTTLLNDVDGLFDSELVALVSLCIGAENAAKVIRGSNPTWFRKPVKGERIETTNLHEETNLISKMMIKDLLEIDSGINKKSNISVKNISTEKLSNKIKAHSIDYIISSPPYMTRIDYIIKQLPSLSILSGLTEISIENLRKKMIGTSKMLNKDDFNPKWGNTCLLTLEQIINHESYASSSYYIWTYSQYFQSMFVALEEFKLCLKKGGMGYLVLQNTHYKDIEVATSEIIIEMLNSKGFEAEVVRADVVKNNMNKLNPSHKKINQKKRSEEKIILFKKIY